MKLVMASILALVTALAAGPITAENFPTPFEPSFTSAATAPVNFNFEITDSMFYYPAAFSWVVFRDTTVASWTMETMSLLYSACSTFTYSGGTVYEPGSGVLEWYLRTENDTAVVTQSPKNGGDIFPAPNHLLADIGYDPIGDAENADGAFVDIVHAMAGYSNSKLYFQLENNGGGFPLNSGLFTYYLYSLGVVDPDMSDSSAYAAIYANVLGLITTGLYRVDLADSSFSRIGNISTSITGNVLHMSCNIADLTSQTGWSSWPPPSGFIGVAPLTATQRGTTLEANDLGKYGIFLPKSSLLDYGAVNSPPLLSDVNVYQIGLDTLAAEVVYTDADDHLPVLRSFNCESTDYAMTACVKDYAAGTLFEYHLSVTETGWYRYYFQFSDGAEMVSTELDSIYVETSAYSPGDANGDGIVNVSDVVYLVAYIFAGGPPPEPLAAGDANCDDLVNVTDAVYLVTYIFAGGPAPCE